MKNLARKLLAALTAMMMLVSAAPIQALAETSGTFTLGADVRVGAVETAFTRVQHAIDSNLTDASPTVSATARLEQPNVAVPTGDFFTYRITYTLGYSPTYNLTDGSDSVAAYSKYDKVTFNFTAPKGVVLYRMDTGSPVYAGETLTIDMTDLRPGSASFNVGARMVGNGVTANDTAFDTLGMSMSADVTVTDVNLALDSTNPRTMSFDAGNVPVNTQNTAVRNTASGNWGASKTGVSAERVGENVAFTYIIEAGKTVGGNITSNVNDYNATGILNFSSFTLTDTLPTFTGVSGSAVNPISATMTPLDANGDDITGEAVSNNGLKLVSSYYNTVQTTGNAVQGQNTSFATPNYTRYRVVALYPASEFKLPFGDSREDDEINFVLTNSIALSYELVGGATGSSTDDATLIYQEKTKPGQIEVIEKLRLTVSGTVTDVNYDLFYSSIFTGPAVFDIYKAEDVEGGKIKEGATPVDSLSIIDTVDHTQNLSIELAPGDYVVFQTAKPADTMDALTNGQAVAVTEDGTVRVTFVNPVENKGLLRFKKITPRGIALGGAEFTLYQNGTATAFKATTAHNDGMAYILATPGEYTLVETKTPAGYVPAAPISVTINEGETIDLDDVVNYTNTASLTFTKYAVTYNKGADAAYNDSERTRITQITGLADDAFTFTLTRTPSPVSESSVWETVGAYDMGRSSYSRTVNNLPITDENGNYYTYRLTETCSDAAFTAVNATREWQFTSGINSSVSYDFYNVLQGSLKLKKTQLVLGTAANSPVNGDASGKVLKLYTKSGSTYTEKASLTTGTDGTVTSGLLPIRDNSGNLIEYFVKEDSASAAGNTVVYPTANADGYYGPITLSAQKLTDLSAKAIVNREEKGQIQIIKTDMGNTRLSGAVFEVYTMSGSDKVYLTNLDGSRMQFTTANNGAVLVNNLDLNKTYYVEEVTAPANYLLSNPAVMEATLTSALQTVQVTFQNPAKPGVRITKTLRNLVMGVDVRVDQRAFEFELYQESNNSMVKVENAGKLTANGSNSNTATTNTVYVENEGDYYLLETTTPSDVISAEIAKRGKGKLVDGKWYFGPFTLSNNKVTTASIENVLNYGRVNITKYDAKTGQIIRSNPATFNVRVKVPASDAVTIAALTRLNFVQEGAAESGIVTMRVKDANAKTTSTGAATFFNLPVYDSNGSKLTYLISEKTAPNGYLLPEDNAVRQATLADQKNHTFSFRYDDPPVAQLTARKVLLRNWESTTGHAITYPYEGVVLALYEVADTLKYVGEVTTNASGLAAFNNLNGMKTYAVVEVSAPDAVLLPTGKQMLAQPGALEGLLSNVLDTYNSVVINMAEKTNNYTVNTTNETLKNYEPYVQFRLTKVDSTDPDKLLAHGKFKLYSATMEEYAAAGYNVASLTDGRHTDHYIYETGTALNELGKFLTEMQSNGRVYWFEEVEPPAGYEIINVITGPFVPQSTGHSGETVYNVDGITDVTVANKPIQGEGDGTIRYIQVELTKELTNPSGNHIKYLANVTFELWLADAAFNRVAALTRFTTGLDTHITSGVDWQGRGISESFEMNRLMAQYPDHITVLENDEYRANFLLVEVSYPVDTTPVQYEYPLTIETNGAETTIDKTYTLEKNNTIKNIQSTDVPVRVRKLGYSAAAPEQTWPLAGVTITLYRDQVMTQKVAEAVTDEHGYANFVVAHSTRYWYKETRTVDGYEISGQTGDFVSPSYGKTESADYTSTSEVITNPQYRELTLRKVDASNAPVSGVTLRITGANGAAIKDSNGAPINGTVKTGADGTATIRLPSGTYEVHEVSIDGQTLTDADRAYFQLINRDVLPITFGADEAAKTVELKNPGKGALEVLKTDDVNVPLADIAFTVYRKDFTTADELLATAAKPDANASGFALIGSSEANSTWTTDADGKISQTNLTPGWYKLVEQTATAEGYVSLAPVIIKVTGTHLGLTGGAAVVPETVVNTRKGYLTINKTFADSALYTVPATLTFNLYTNEACTTPATPASVTLDIRNLAGTAQVALDPGTYYVQEQTGAWYSQYGVDGAASAWLNGAVAVTITASNTTELPVVLNVANVPTKAKVTLLKTDDQQPANPVEGVQFSIYYLNGATRLYYQPNDTWTENATTAKTWMTTAEGRVELEVVLPYSRVNVANNEYFISEVSTPAQYVPAADFSVSLTPGAVLDRTDTPVVNATGLQIQLVKYGRAYAYAQEGDVLADADFTLYRLSGKSLVQLATGTTDANGKISFGNLPKLENGDSYVIEETFTPGTHVAGLMEVYIGGQKVEPVTIGRQTVYPVAANADVTVSAYNTPKGGIAILKYNYLKPTEAGAVPERAEFEVRDAEKKLIQTVNVSHYRDDNPATLAGGSVAKGSTYYQGVSGTYDGYVFTSAVLTGLAPGTYTVTETTPAENFYYTPASNPGDPWYPVREVTIGEDGEVAVCYIANVPDPELPELNIEKHVSSVNGQAATYRNNGAVIPSLQSGWQEVTYQISGFATDIQVPLKWVELRDQDIVFTGSGNRTATNTEYRMLSVKLGKVSAASDVYATVYGINGATETKLRTVNVSDGDQTVSLNGSNVFTGMLIVYGTDSTGSSRVGMDAGFTAGTVELTVRMRQDSGEAVIAAKEVTNTAMVRMSYNIGIATEQEATTEWKSSTASAVTENELELPSGSITKTANKLDDNGAPVPDILNNNYLMPGESVLYTVTFTNNSPNDMPIVDPVIVDLMPDNVEFDAAKIKVSAPDGVTTSRISSNGRYAYAVLTGELKPGGSVVMTITGTVRFDRVLDPKGDLVNNAYALSTKVLNKNDENPYGTSFKETNGAFPASVVNGDVFGGAEASYQAISASTTHTLTGTTQLTLYKMVSADQSGLSNYYGAERVATASAGGQINYVLTLVNGGNTNVDRVRLIDKLPYANDTVVGSSVQRDSRWQVKFKGTAPVVRLNGKTIDAKVYTTTALESGGNYIDAVQEGNTAGWVEGVAPDARAVMIELDEALVLKPTDQVTVSFECVAPDEQSALANDAYFRLADNDGKAAVYEAGTNAYATVSSNRAKVTLMPEPVALGDRVWIDVNGNGLQDEGDLDYTGQDVGMVLRTFVNSDSGASSAGPNMMNATGYYGFSNLAPAEINTGSYTVDSAYNSEGDIINSRLTGSMRTSYQLAVTGIPAGYIATTPYAGNGGAVPKVTDGYSVGGREIDSNFRNRSGSEWVTEKFYLPSGANDLTYDLGLIRVRNLSINKVGTDGRAIQGASFEIYGPYTDTELYGVNGGALVLDAGKLVDTITTDANGDAAYISTNANHYLNYYRNYVVVESDSSQTYYLKNGLVATGSGIATAAQYKVSGGSVSVDNYFILRSTGTSTAVSVSVTDTYVANGSLQISGNKTLIGGDLTAGSFTFKLTSANDADFRAKFPNGSEVTNGQVANMPIGFFQFEDIAYDYADAGQTYTYTLAEVNTGTDGIAYDTQAYTITAVITDNGNGTLNVQKTCMDHQNNSVALDALAFTNTSQGTLVLTKTVGGNAGDINKLFAFSIALTERNGTTPVTGTFNCSSSSTGGAADGGNLTSVTFDAQGKATVYLKHGQRLEISGLLTNTRYTVTEENYTAEGYVTTPASREATGSIARTDTPNVAAFTNTRDVGEIEISKSVSGNAADLLTEYNFTLTLTNADGMTVDGAYKAQLNGVDTTDIGVANGTATFSMGAGDRLTLMGIPHGTAYTVAETDYASLAYATAATGQQGAIDRDVPASASFTNTRNTGSLTVGKALAGNATDATKAFEVTIRLIAPSGVNLEAIHALSPFTYEAAGGYTPAVGNAVLTSDAQGLKVVVSLRGGESYTLKNLPVGTQYNVIETDSDATADAAAAAENYLYTVTYQPGNPIGTIALNGGEANVSLLNTRNSYGGLVISKVVSGNAGDNQKDFTFTVMLHKRNDAVPPQLVYVCSRTLLGNTPTRENLTFTEDANGDLVAVITLKHNESFVIPNILTGTRYTVTEADYEADGYVTNAGANNNSVRSQTGEINNRNQTYAAAFVNVRNTGLLTVAKQVQGNAGDENKLFNYTLSLSRTDTAPIASSYPAVLTTSNADGSSSTASMDVSVAVAPDGKTGTASFQLTHNQSLTIGSLLLGTNYRVTEDSYFLEGYSTTPSSRTYAGAINARGALGVAGETAEYAPYINTRNAGPLSISKVVTGNAADLNLPFTFHIHLSRTDGVPVYGDYSIELNGQPAGTITVDANGDATYSLIGGQTLTILGVLNGTAYSVTEEDYTGIGYVTTNTLNSGVMTSGGAQVTYTNSRSTGSLTLRKVLAGNAVEADREFTFVVRITNPNGSMFNGDIDSSLGNVHFDSGNATVRLVGGQSITMYGLLAGSTYSITEVEADQNGYTTTRAGAFGVIVGGVTATATYTNTRDIMQRFRNLTVVKTWDDSSDRDEIRPVTVTVYLYADGNAINRCTLSAASGWSYTFNDLPVLNIDGSEIRYTVVETATAEYYAGYTYNNDGVSITNTHIPDRFYVLFNDGMVPLGGNINMNEGDCFN